MKTMTEYEEEKIHNILRKYDNGTITHGQMHNFLGAILLFKYRTASSNRHYSKKETK